VGEVDFPGGLREAEISGLNELQPGVAAVEVAPLVSGQLIPRPALNKEFEEVTTTEEKVSVPLGKIVVAEVNGEEAQSIEWLLTRDDEKASLLKR
jgi:hypothetical protein